jgi:hypothetical protein
VAARQPNGDAASVPVSEPVARASAEQGSRSPLGGWATDWPVAQVHPEPTPKDYTQSGLPKRVPRKGAPAGATLLGAPAGQAPAGSRQAEYIKREQLPTERVPQEYLPSGQAAADSAPKGDRASQQQRTPELARNRLSGFQRGSRRAKVRSYDEGADR